MEKNLATTCLQTIKNNNTLLLVDDYCKIICTKNFKIL